MFVGATFLDERDFSSSSDTGGLELGTVIRKPLAAAAALALLAVGCGGGAKAETVSLKLIAFHPERVEVKAGSAVTWRNDDGTTHTVTSGQVAQQGGSVSVSPDGTFDSGQLAAGKTFTFKPAKPGTYSYYCQIHPATMRGEIIVK